MTIQFETSRRSPVSAQIAFLLLFVLTLDCLPLLRIHNMDDSIRWEKRGQLRGECVQWCVRRNGIGRQANPLAEGENSGGGTTTPASPSAAAAGRHRHHRHDFSWGRMNDLSLFESPSATLLPSGTIAWLTPYTTLLAMQIPVKGMDELLGSHVRWWAIMPSS